MDINQFNIYSMLSAVESADKDNLENILAEIAMFKEMSSASDVIDYLKSKYSIELNTCQFYIANNTPVKIYNTKETLSLEISVGNKEFLYCYCKGELDE